MQNSRLSQRLNKLISITDETARLLNHLRNLSNNIQNYDNAYGPDNVTNSSSIMHPLLKLKDLANNTHHEACSLMASINSTLEE
mgnify:CR=1 FL=1